MALRISAFIRRLIVVQLLALVPALLFCQITIRERVEITSAPAKQFAMTETLATLPTLRFEFTAGDTGRAATLWVGLPSGGALTADGIGGAVLAVPNAPVGSYQPSLILYVADIPFGAIIPVTLKIFVDSALARTDQGYIRTSGYDVWAYWMPPSYYHFPVRIKITLTSSELAPLGDSDNKANPNPSDTKRPKVIDYSRAKSTPMSVSVTDLEGNPVRNYQLTFRAFGKDTTGGHIHDLHVRPGGRFVTARQETTYMLQARTDSTGKVQCKYQCSGTGGVDSIYVRGTSPIDTATALVSVRVQGMMELPAGAHYELIGGVPRHPSNHFGTKKTIDKLQMLADSAYADSSWTLQYNDISLISGGPFDCDSTHRWDTPHQTHREGKNVDMRPTSTDEKRIDVRWLRDMIEKKLKGKIFEENKDKPGHHFHLTF